MSKNDILPVGKGSSISKVTLLSLSRFPENRCPCCQEPSTRGEQLGLSGEAASSVAWSEKSSLLPMTWKGQRVCLEKPKLKLESKKRCGKRMATACLRHPVQRFAGQASQISNAVTRTSSQGRKLPPGGGPGVAGSRWVAQSGGAGARPTVSETAGPRPPVSRGRANAQPRASWTPDGPVQAAGSESQGWTRKNRLQQVNSRVFFVFLFCLFFNTF